MGYMETFALLAALGLTYVAIWRNVADTVDLCLNDLRRSDKKANPYSSRYNSDALTTTEGSLTTTKAEKYRLFTGEFSYP